MKWIYQVGGMNYHSIVRNLNLIGNLIWSPYIVKQRCINIPPRSSSWPVDDDPSISPRVDIPGVWSEPRWAAPVLDEPQWPGPGGHDEDGPHGGEAGQGGPAGAGPQPGHLPCPEAGAGEAQAARGGEHWPGQEVPQPNQQPVQVRSGLQIIQFI